MGQIKTKISTQMVFNKERLVTKKVQYSTIKSDLLIARMAQTAGIKESTARNAFLGIAEAVRYFVLNGHSINLGKFGYLKVGVNAQSVAKASQVNKDLVQKVFLNYLPSTAIKAELANISLN